MAKRHCPNCGADLEKGISFCTSCGCPLQEKEATGTGAKKKAKPVVLIAFLVLIGLAVIVLAALLLFAPDSKVSLSIKNAVLSLKEISAFGREMIGLGIALLVLVGGVAAYRLIAGKRGRKIHAEEWGREQELTGSVLVIDAAVDPGNVYDTMTQILDDRKARQEFLPKGKMTFSDVENGVTHGTYQHRGLLQVPDSFRAAVTFQDLKNGGIRTFMEIVQWEERNGVARKSCLQAMKGIGDLLISVITRMDPQAQIGTYGR